jgi:hypothetical protein
VRGENLAKAFPAPPPDAPALTWPEILRVMNQAQSPDYGEDDEETPPRHDLDDKEYPARHDWAIDHVDDELVNDEPDPDDDMDPMRPISPTQPIHPIH